MLAEGERELLISYTPRVVEKTGREAGAGARSGGAGTRAGAGADTGAGALARAQARLLS